MIDTGAEPNFVKISSLGPNANINKSDVLKITGITATTVTTLGSTTLNILGKTAKFFIVPNDFPTRADGIIGSAMLQNGAIISFQDNTLLLHDRLIEFSSPAKLPQTVSDTEPRLGSPSASNMTPPRGNRVSATQRETAPRSVPRPPQAPTTFRKTKNWAAKTPVTETPPHIENADAHCNKERPQEVVPKLIRARTIQCIPIRVTGPTVGYLQKTEISSEVIILDSVVTNDKGRAYVKCINLTESDVSPAIPELQLHEFDDAATAPVINHISQPNQTASLEIRYSAIRELIETDHLNAEEAEHVHELIQQYHDLFHLPTDRLGKTTAVTHKIPTIDNIPVRVKQYRYPQIHKREIDTQMRELLNNDIVEPSSSPYNSPLWIVPKKSDANGNNKWRMVIDYRALNEKSVPDAYPLPNIVEILDQLGSAKYFSVFDLASGFHQIGMEKEHAEKTAFSTPYGHYEFKRMPFGLRNAPATFQRLMDAILTGLQGTELFVYLDDIVIYARSLAEHKHKFERLAARLREASLKLQPSKCGFLHKEVAYLGHRISEDGVRPSVDKIKAIMEFPTPKNVRQTREFLGLAGYYRRFIDSYSRVAKPLTNLLKKDKPYEWGADQERAFRTQREALCEEPLLAYPNFDNDFNVTTDASGFAVGSCRRARPGTTNRLRTRHVCYRVPS